MSKELLYKGIVSLTLITTAVSAADSAPAAASITCGAAARATVTDKDTQSISIYSDAIKNAQAILETIDTNSSEFDEETKEIRSNIHESLTCLEHTEFPPKGYLLSDWDNDILQGAIACLQGGVTGLKENNFDKQSEWFQELASADNLLLMILLFLSEKSLIEEYKTLSALVEQVDSYKGPKGGEGDPITRIEQLVAEKKRTRRLK